MVVKKKTARGRQATARRQKAIFDKEVEETRHLFEQTYSIIDAAVTGSLISGIPPGNYEPLLSYWFLRLAVAARGKPDEELKELVKNYEVIFPRIIESVIDFADEFDIEVDDVDRLELAALREEFGVKPVEESELDQRRNDKKSLHVVEWTMDTLSRNEDLPAMIVELAFLLQWLKIAALNESIDDEHYIVLKETVPLMHQAYDPILAEYLT